MEQNKMTPTPWVLFEADRPGIDSADGETVILFGDNTEQAGIKNKIDAAAIVSAVNNTYGIKVNPQVVPELIRTLKNMCDYFDWLMKDPNFLAYREAKAAIEKAKL